MNEQDIAVDEYLKANGIEFSAYHLGRTSKDQWDCDAWRVTLTHGKRSMTADYYTGLGHRKTRKGAPKPPTNPRCIAYAEWKRDYKIPTKPTAASVLYCLLSDATSSEEPFDYWCDNLGYDSDSLKALNIYNASCAARNELYRLLGGHRKPLAELLEDY